MPAGGSTFRIYYKAWNTSTSLFVAEVATNHSITIHTPGGDVAGSPVAVGGGDYYVDVDNADLAVGESFSLRGTSSGTDVVIAGVTGVRPEAMRGTDNVPDDSADIAAIKTVTDALPDAGALTSIATAAALATLSGNVSTVLGVVNSNNADIGDAINSIENLNNFNPSTDQVIVATNNDKTGYGLTASERSTLAGVIDLAIINQGDGADLITAIADAIAQDWIAGDGSPLAIVSALKADSEWITLIADAAAAKVAGESNGTSLSGIGSDVTAARSAAEAAEAGVISVSEIWTGLDSTQLSKFLTIDTGQTAAVSGSVAKIAQGSAGGAVEVGSFSSPALVQLVSDDTGEASAASGSVAKLSQGSSIGGGSTVVLPTASVIPDRSDLASIPLFTGETIAVSITVFESDGVTAHDLTGEDLTVVIEEEDGTDLAVVASGDISIASNVATFTVPAAVTAKAGLAPYALRRESGDGYVFATGHFRIRYSPGVG